MNQFLLTLMMMVAALSGRAQMCVSFPMQPPNPQDEPLNQVEPGYLLGNDCGSVFVKIKYHILTDGTSSTFFANQKARLNLGILKATQTFLEHDIFLHTAAIDSFYVGEPYLDSLRLTGSPAGYIIGNNLTANWFLPIADVETDYLHVFIGPNTGSGVGMSAHRRNFI